MIQRLSWTLGLFLLFLFLARSASASSISFFNQSTFAASTGALSVATFDSLGACNNCLAAINASVAGIGLSIVQTAGLGVNVVQNIGTPFGANFVTAANINSGLNAISSSIFTNIADQSADSFDFIFANPVSAAGLFIGNLGNASNTQTTLVSFLDASNNVIASDILDQLHVGVIAGPFVATVPWDDRIFYGITSTTLIKRIRVVNGPNDGDGIDIDDVQFSAAATTVPEPGTFVLLGTAVIAMAFARCTRSRTS